MRGVITDPSGGVIPDATVSIINGDNGFLRRNVSDASGEYKFLQIAPGTYEVMAEKEGFATMTRSDEHKKKDSKRQHPKLRVAEMKWESIQSQAKA